MQFAAVWIGGGGGMVVVVVMCSKQQGGMGLWLAADRGTSRGNRGCSWQQSKVGEGADSSLILFHFREVGGRLLPEPRFKPE